MLLNNLSDIFLHLGISRNTIDRTNQLDVELLVRFRPLVNRVSVITARDEICEQVLKFLSIHGVDESTRHH